MRETERREGNREKEKGKERERRRYRKRESERGEIEGGKREGDMETKAIKHKRREKGERENVTKDTMR